MGARQHAVEPLACFVGRDDMVQRPSFGHRRVIVRRGMSWVGMFCMNRGLNTIKAVVIGLGLGIIGLTILIVMVIIDKIGDSAVDGETVGFVSLNLPIGRTANNRGSGRRLNSFEREFTRNVQRRNWMFTEVATEVNAETYWPWGVATADLNSDGFEDAFVTASMNFNYRYHVNSVLLNDRGRG